MMKNPEQTMTEIPAYTQYDHLINGVNPAYVQYVMAQPGYRYSEFRDVKDHPYYHRLLRNKKTLPAILYRVYLWIVGTQPVGWNKNYVNIVFADGSVEKLETKTYNKALALEEKYLTILNNHAGKMNE